MNNTHSFSSFQLVFLSIRPKTLVASLCPVAVGSVMAFLDEGGHLISAILCLTTAFFIQIGTNLANDYFDFQHGADTVNRQGPKRVTAEGLVPPHLVKRFAILCFVLAFVIGCLLVFRAGYPLFFLGLLCLISGWCYTGGPYPLGYHGLGDVFVLIFFGPVAVAATYYVQALIVSPETILIGFCIGLLCTALIAVNNLRDRVEDKKHGKNTLAVKYGPTFVRIEYLLCLILPSLLPLLLILKDEKYVFFVFLFWNLWLAKPAYRNIFSDDAMILNPLLEKTAKLLVSYSILLCAALYFIKL